MKRRAVTTTFIETRFSAICPVVSSDGEERKSTHSDHVDVSHRGWMRNDGAPELSEGERDCDWIQKERKRKKHENKVSRRTYGTAMSEADEV